MTDDLDRRLERWGDAPSPAPDPEFATRLEQDLRSLVYFGAADPTPPPMPWWRRIPARPAFSLAALVLVGAVLVSMLRDDPMAATALTMGPVTDTAIELPDGAIDDAEIGAALPDGTVIRVGDDGSAIVGDVVLDAGTVADVIDGRVQIRPTDAPTDRPSPLPVPTIADQDSPEPTAAPTAEPTAAPTATPQPEPTATAERDGGRDGTPQPEPTPASTATAVPEPTAEPLPVPPGEPAAIDLVVTPRPEQQLLLEWSAPGDIDVAGWEIVVVIGDETRTAVVVRDPTARNQLVRRPEANAAQWRVIGRATDGDVVAISALVPSPSGE